MTLRLNSPKRGRPFIETSVLVVVAKRQYERSSPRTCVAECAKTYEAGGAPRIIRRDGVVTRRVGTSDRAREESNDSIRIMGARPFDVDGLFFGCRGGPKLHRMKFIQNFNQVFGSTFRLVSKNLGWRPPFFAH